LVRRLGEGNGNERVVLDFARVRFLIPGATVAILAKVRSWLKPGRSGDVPKPQELRGERLPPAMDFFKLAGVPIEEEFERHPRRHRFVELQRISHDAARSVPELSADVAECFFPEEDQDAWETGESGAWGYVEFAVSELANNVLQHSRSRGYLAAQYCPRSDRVRIAIADCGIGIRRSFRGSPFEAQAASDLDAVRLALRPRVSGKEHLETVPGTSVNRGMGLTFLHELSRRANGSFRVISGSGCYRLEGDGTLPAGSEFQGTFCALSV
jgi:hypothetical protein